MTATDRDPPGWITRLRKIERRRGTRCRVCGEPQGHRHPQRAALPGTRRNAPAANHPPPHPGVRPVTMHPVHSDNTCSHSWCRAHARPRDVAATTDDDGHAVRAVQLARRHLEVTRRRFMRRQVGATDVHAAEAALDQALERLARANAQRSQ